MIITLKPETEEKLRKTAEWEGQDVDTLASTILGEALEQRAKQFDENVRAAKAGLDAIDQGRTRPFEEYLAEHRLRYPDAGTLL